MFDSLSGKLQNVFRNLRGLGKISEENVAEALREVRLALLEADVNFKVARDFIERVKSKSIGQEVIQSIQPGQQIIKIIHDELVKLLGEGKTELSPARPLKIMMVGLHGSGKTTSAAKLGRVLKKRSYRPFVVGCDVYRPAAIDQLEILAKQEELGFYSDRVSKDVPAIGTAGLAAAKEQNADCIIFDTAGRLQIDQDLIEEVKRLRAAIQPDEVFLVADGALGQEAVNVAKTFHEALQLTGLVLTKLDSDARGGAALSVRAVTGVPVKFVTVSERMDGLEVFHPDRLAQRILGMGDVLTLIERAQSAVDAEEAAKLQEKLMAAEFDLEDFRKHLKRVRSMGPLDQLMKMLPGASDLAGMMPDEFDEKELDMVDAIINSMTMEERQYPDVINASRKRRIARGSGTRTQDVNIVLKEYRQLAQMMSAMAKGKEINIGGLRFRR